MRRGFETTLVGIAIGIAVVLVRGHAATGSQYQWLVWCGAAVLIVVFHALLRRSLHRMMPPSAPSAPPPASTPRRLRPTRIDPFAKEFDRSWTGLAEPTEAPVRRREFD